jgi:hypothetical protein
VRRLPALFVRDVDSLPFTLLTHRDANSNLLACSCDVSIDAAASWPTVYRDLVDASMSEVSGPGTVGFVRRNVARNRISVVPHMPSGAVAAYVSVEDVGVDVVGGSAVVSAGVSGSFNCVYTVDEGVLEVGIRISICSVLVWTGAVSCCKITGRHVQSHAVIAGDKAGLAVSHDCCYMVLSYMVEHVLRVYRLEADGAATLLHTVGSEGAGPMQFDGPAKMCLTPAGNLLVCDYGNKRVQELTSLGEAEPQHVRFFPIDQAWSLAMFGYTLAVGTTSCIIQLLSYASGAIIRSISSDTTALIDCCTSIRFTSDGQHIVAAYYDSVQLTMFCVSDGGFVKHIGVDADCNKDIEFAPNGDLLVADYNKHRVCVISADGDTLAQSWGTQGEADGQFSYPIALARVDCQLFVLDAESARVQVFE